MEDVLLSHVKKHPPRYIVPNSRAVPAAVALGIARIDGASQRVGINKEIKKNNRKYIELKGIITAK